MPVSTPVDEVIEPPLAPMLTAPTVSLNAPRLKVPPLTTMALVSPTRFEAPSASVPPVMLAVGEVSELPVFKVSVPAVTVAEVVAVVAELREEAPLLLSAAVLSTVLTVPPVKVAEVVAVSALAPLSVPDRAKVLMVSAVLTDRVAPEATLTAAVSASALPPESARVPAETVVAPVKVLVPESVVVPVPLCVKADPVPARMAETVPVLGEVLLKV